MTEKNPNFDLLPHRSTSMSALLMQKSVADKVIDMTPMKLIKLVYVTHGWVLGILDRPLISEPIEAWKYGPVIRPLYHRLKGFADSPVPSSVFSADEIAKLDESTANVVDAVWDAYKDASGIQLSSITHRAGSPWYVTWHELGGSDRRCAIIDNMLIRDYYRKLSEKKA
jgi:uncharacterized phage-associated protein